MLRRLLPPRFLPIARWAYLLLSIYGLYERMFPNWMETVKQELKGCSPILDLGCGYNSPVQHRDVPYKVAKAEPQPETGLADSASGDDLW